jgi:hypothetical protein
MQSGQHLYLMPFELIGSFASSCFYNKVPNKKTKFQAC